jgi:hypothetical protein
VVDIDAGEPARHHGPAKQEMGGSGASDKRKKETDKSDGGGLLPFELEHLRVELGAG